MREMSWDRRRGQTDELKQMSHQKKYRRFVLFSCIGDLVKTHKAYVRRKKKVISRCYLMQCNGKTKGLFSDMSGSNMYL